MKFSQHNEEEFIQKFFAGKTNGLFVDIGANDGITGSNTRCLWERGWSGVMVEGCLATYENLVKNYAGVKSIKCVWACVGLAEDEFATFYAHKTIPNCGWNSADESWIRAMDINNYESSKTPACTMGDLGIPNEFDFLSIDTEGGDFDVIQGMPETMKPRLIMAEIDKHDNSFKIDSVLTYRGYTKVWEDEVEHSNAAYALP